MNSLVSLDHLVGAGEQAGRNAQALGFCRLEVDLQHDGGCLFDGEVCRTVSLQNTIDIVSRTPPDQKEIGRI